MGFLSFFGNVNISQPIANTKKSITKYSTPWELSKADISLRANKRSTSLFRSKKSNGFPVMSDYKKKKYY